MANPQFTPGPWYIQHHNIRNADIQTLIAKVDYSYAEGPANAHLIAAAPELYESGCELRQAMHDYMVIPNREVADAITKFDAALTKAGGKSNA